jgi:CRISPR-associated protein Cmr2
MTQPSPSTHLMAVTLGPVQEFISAARRTRDLWFGSYLLSEISKAAARELCDRGAELIFPSPASPELLKPDTEFNVVNVILAELPGATNPADLWPMVKQSCAKRLSDLADGSVKGLPNDWFVRDRWKGQLEDVIEFYAAWLPLEPGSDYAKRRVELMRLVAGRKACRDFSRWDGEWGVPKSSLDGARETVLKALSDSEGQRRARKLKLSEGEQLDAIGLVKRRGGGLRQYPSVARVAADPWLRGLTQQEREDLDRVCLTLSPFGLTRLPPGRFPQYADFPHDGAVVYETRHAEAVDEAGDDQKPALLAPLRERLNKLWRKYGAPSPYLAILVADGDRMGKAISGIRDIPEHRKFSSALSGFAGKAREIIQSYQGVAVYAGGDDLLAFLPLDGVIPCARQLRESFCDSLKPCAPDPPTLSVGIAVGHMMEPLEDLLECGRKAEKAAKKPDRDGLAVAMYPRSGAPAEYRARWSCRPDELLKTLADWHLRGLIPDKAAYDLKRLAEFYEACAPGGWRQDAMQADALRVLNRKEIVSDAAYGQIESAIHSASEPRELGDFARAMVIARRLAEALRQAGQATVWKGGAGHDR